MNKVSVIIAAYNVEEYIAETINSVVAQTLKDIEIVIVDDCSTDSTFDIISKCAELDDRIKVVRHEVNKSLMQVRQTGLRNASGEYVIFLDGDDKLTPDACEKAYKAIKSEKVDMLQFNFKLLFVPPVKPDKNIEREFREAMHSVTHKVVSHSKAGVLDEKAVGDIINLTIWDKIYKKELLEKAGKYLPNEYINMAEDVFYSFLIHYHARSYSYIPDKLYLYRFGCGMSTVATLSERILKFIAKNAYVYNYLYEWVNSIGAQKECALALCRVHQKLYSHIVITYFCRTQKEQKKPFITEVLKYGKVSDLVLAVSDQIYNNTFTPKRVAEECSFLDAFATTKTKAKTIGVYYFRMYNGGVENVISSLTDIWVKSGYNVVLFTDEAPNKDDYYINPSVKRVIVPKIKDNEFFTRKKRIEEFRKALIENEVDVMVYNAWNSPDLVLDEMIIKSCGVNLVIHTHSMFCGEIGNMDGMYAYRYSSLPKLYSFADSVIALSEVDAAWYETLGIKTFRTRNPIQFDTNVKTAELNGHNMLFVGRISEEKRVTEALKIAALVRKEIPDATLTVVGRGDEINYIEEVDEYISQNKLKDFVNMVGFKSNTLPYYQAADVMLATSRIEGSPLSWLESKICGVPMVCYSLPHLDYTRECKGMVVVDQLDAQEAANAVIKMFKDDDYKKQLGRDARESAEEYLNIDLASHWKNIFEQTLIPKPKAEPLYKLTPAEIAVRIAVENYSEGIYKRSQMVQSGVNSPKLAELEDELARFKRSETYRVGRIVTFIPRLIKSILKRIFKRNKE